MGACGACQSGPPPKEAPLSRLEVIREASMESTLASVSPRHQMEKARIQRLEAAKRADEEAKVEAMRRSEDEKQQEKDREVKEKADRQAREVRERQLAEERERLRRIIKCQAVVRKWGVRRWYIQERAYMVSHLIICQKLCRGRQARKLAVRLFQSRKRFRLSVGELLTTEQRYCESLTVCVEVFYRSFVSASQPGVETSTNPPIKGSKIAWSTVETIFSNINTLSNAHNTMLPQLTQLLSPPVHIGVLPKLRKMLLDLANQVVTFYPEYINNFMKGQAELARFHLHPESVVFLEGIHEKYSDRIGSQTLSSFLIMPIQRPPRYRLLLQELVKSIDPYYTQGMAEMEEALSRIDQVASSINEIQRNYEEREKFVALTKLIKENKKEVKELDDGRRALIAETKVTEFSGPDNSFPPRECYLILLTDLLLVTEQSKTRPTFTTNFKKMGSGGGEAKAEIKFAVLKKLTVANPFMPFQVSELPDLPTAHFALRIEANECDWQGESPSSKIKALFFDFESEDARKVWLGHFRRLHKATWRDEEDTVSVHL